MKICGGRRVLAGSLIVLGLLAGPVRAEEESTDEGIAAVITKINGQKKSFEALIAEELSPHRQKIQEAFAETVGSLDDLVLQMRRNPRDGELAKKYNEVLAGALQSAESMLSDYSRLREPTRRNLSNLSNSMTAARSRYEREMTSQRTSLARHKQEAREVEQKLEKLAERHRAVLVSGEGRLTREAELEIQLLDADLQVALQNERFDELAIQDYAEALEELDRQKDELSTLSNSLEVTFRTAEGQAQLLSKITELRDRRQQGGRLAGNIATLKPIVEFSTTQNVNVGELIEKFLDHDVRLNRRPRKQSSPLIATPSRATEIMSRYLKTSEKEANHASN